MLLESYQAFESRNYLEHYYSEIGIENQKLLGFLANAYQDIPAHSTLLEFGGGPTIYALIAAARHVKSIDFADFLPCNLEEIKLWQQGSNQSFTWKNFFETALLIEEGQLDQQRVAQRELLLRQKLSQFLLCDAFESNPLGPAYRHYYDVVSTNFVAESITSSHSVWETLVENICSTLKPGGTLIMTAIAGATYYCINGNRFPAIAITEIDLVKRLIQLGFKSDAIYSSSILAEISDATAPGYKGYSGMIFVKAKKS
jgi:hypothetical protein